MKTVLISAYACIPGQGSEEGTGWTYASTLSQNGYRVHCLTKKDGQSVIDSILASGQYPNLTVHYVHVPDWVNTFCKKGLIGMYFHYIYWQWAASDIALALRKTDPIDLVHHVSYGSIQLGSFMYRLNKPFVFGPVGGGQRAPKSMKRYFGSFWTREWMRDWVGTLLQHVNPAFYQTVRQADQLIVTNLDTLRLARTLRPTAPVERIWDASLSRTFLPAEPVRHTPGSTLKLLWVGRLLPRKALELTIQALGQVDPAIPVTLTIVGGKGEMVEHVPGYLERYGVADRVDWVGHVTFQQVKEYYEQSDVFFFTSLRDSCPHQLLEAMAYSLPVVTLKLHGQDELVDDSTGIRVPVGTEEQVVSDLARAIEWMYHHPTERLAMGQAGYNFARTQLWDTKIRLFTDRIYPAILSEPAVLAEHD